MNENNLNNLRISTDSPVTKTLQDFTTSNSDKNIKVYFKNLENHLINCIEDADVIVGCVAWLRSKPILKALANKKGVSIIVQKEDFLRPDLNNRKSSDIELNQLYNSIPNSLTRYDTGLQNTILHMMSFAGDSTIESIRCVGNHNADKKPAFPRSHHKFVVFCRLLNNPKSEYGGEIMGMNYEPYSVWTGSFNFTYNATMSFENAVLIKDETIVRAFFNEYAQIAAISEPLDWNSTWTEPEWRIGS